MEHVELTPTRLSDHRQISKAVMNLSNGFGQIAFFVILADAIHVAVARVEEAHGTVRHAIDRAFKMFLHGFLVSLHVVRGGAGGIFGAEIDAGVWRLKIHFDEIESVLVHRADHGVVKSIG